MISYGLQHALGRPLGLLLLDVHTDATPTGVRFDAGLAEREVTRPDPHPANGQPTRRMVVLQCEPLADEAVERCFDDEWLFLLRFTREEVCHSFGAGERVLDFALSRWGWKALDETRGQRRP